MKNLSRKSFVKYIAGASGLLVVPSILYAQQVQPTKTEKLPPLETSLVKEFVGNAHRDFARVKTMLDEYPDLLNSVNNLGGWDWEDALGAAGHVGIPDMANYLLEKGARMTICVAAMLGKIQIVRPMIEAFPYMKDSVGPHKISLMRHAKTGGQNSLVVLDYLKSIGAKE